MKRSWRVVAVAVLLAGTTGLSACTADNHKLPTLGGSTSAKSGDLVAVAKTYYDCMTDAGVPVELQPNQQGDLAVVQIAPNHTAMWRNADGSGGAMTADNAGPDSPEQQKINDFFSATQTDPAMLVDGVDYTTQWLACLDKSGYDEQAAYGPIQMDPAQLQKQVQSNNKWAACARENGWPGVKDSTMPVKLDGSEWPTVLLPPTITADQLRQLLRACPNFDAAKATAINEYWQNNPAATSYPGDDSPDPSISFDVPGMNGTGDPPDQKVWDQLQPLFDILYEAQNAYYSTQSEGASVALPTAKAT